MKKYYDVLRRCSLFEGISDSDLMPMMGCVGGTVKKFDKRENIFSEGEEAKKVGIMLSGSAQIVRVDYYGNRTIMENVSPSELCGESFACGGADEIPVDIVATESSEVLLMDSARITRSCSNACGFHQQMIFNLMKIMAVKNLRFHQKIEITSKRTTREKLMTYLMIEAKKKRSDTFDIPYDRQELADYLEVDRSGLSAEISKLRREGVLLSEKNRFTLLDRRKI
ncbi:MAG: Crp/Fnr family transcriptional regulator [Ruminococcaceae bacterium]|nr:Crp/Fnr family transcriptional regulator [Oscillospiraceae bacterium]